MKARRAKANIMDDPAALVDRVIVQRVYKVSIANMVRDENQSVDPGMIEEHGPVGKGLVAMAADDELLRHGQPKAEPDGGIAGPFDENDIRPIHQRHAVRHRVGECALVIVGRIGERASREQGRFEAVLQASFAATAGLARDRRFDEFPVERADGDAAGLESVDRRSQEAPVTGDHEAAKGPVPWRVPLRARPSGRGEPVVAASTECTHPFRVAAGPFHPARSLLRMIKGRGAIARSAGAGLGRPDEGANRPRKLLANTGTSSNSEEHAQQGQVEAEDGGACTAWVVAQDVVLQFDHRCR